MRQLVENALGYIRPGQGLFDEVSGYPREGWNDGDGLSLRGFTQLTTIGEWTEVLAHVAAGFADQSYLTRADALKELDKVSHSLVEDQADPLLGDHGLLCNFIGFEKGRRISPLGADVYKKDFISAYGEKEGEAVWRALEKAGWVKPLASDEQGEIIRGPGYGYGQAGFRGALTPYASHDGQIKLMTLMDRRVVQIVFGDNANLSASVGKTIGMLLEPGIRNDPVAMVIRERLELFLDRQQAGYRNLYDAQRGLFRFGWNATHGNFVGWADESGVWQAAHADYFVNEFRGPMAFVVVRFGFPETPLRDQAFKVKSRMVDGGRELFTLAPWEGSAFQILGLSLFMGERQELAWRKSLENAVRINLNYSRVHGLPGFLSESYSGNGHEYSGKIGIPDLAVVRDPRITNAPSLYTLGVAYSLLPDEVERFLQHNWAIVSSLFTEHGPWEGFHTGTRQPIRCQTAVHVMSLILGAIGKGDEAMHRYLAQRGLVDALLGIYPAGKPADLLARSVRTVEWSPDGSAMTLERGRRGFRMSGDKVRKAAVTWLFDRPGEELALSGGEWRLRYRNRGAAIRAVISLERQVAEGRWASQEIFVNLHHTGLWSSREVEIPLPATPGLLGIRKVTVLLGSDHQVQDVDVTLKSMTFTPASGI